MKKEISLIEFAEIINDARAEKSTKESVHRKCIQANSLNELLEKMEAGREMRSEIASRFVGRIKSPQ